jgi:hypothetical protein
METLYDYSPAHSHSPSALRLRRFRQIDQHIQFFPILDLHTISMGKWIIDSHCPFAFPILNESQDWKGKMDR